MNIKSFVASQLKAMRAGSGRRWIAQNEEEARDFLTRLAITAEVARADLGQVTLHAESRGILVASPTPNGAWGVCTDISGESRIVGTVMMIPIIITLNTLLVQQGMILQAIAGSREVEGVTQCHLFRPLPFREEKAAGSEEPAE